MDAKSSAISGAVWLSAVAVVLTASAVPVSADTPESITVQAQREREKLEHDVNQFVSTAIAQSHYDKSLERWTYAPVCPLVAGVSKELGEYVLARVSATNLKSLWKYRDRFESGTTWAPPVSTEP